MEQQINVADVVEALSVQVANLARENALLTAQVKALTKQAQTKEEENK